MTKLLFAAAFVAALAVVATAKPLSVNDNPTPVTCLECTVLGDLVEVLRKQGKTKDQIDTEVQAICARLPMPLKNQCQNAVSTQLDPLLSALDKTNGVVHTACQQIGKCAPATLGTSLPDCAACEVEAAVLKKALKATTADELIANLNMACDRLPVLFEEKCSKIVHKLKPLISELASKPTESSPQACQAVSRCIASSNMFEGLVQKFVSQPADNPIECLACTVEAALLKNLLQTNTKAQIDANITMLCNKLPDQLKQKCLDGITNLINPLIDQLVQNQNETPKQACQAIGKCAQSADEDLEQLVEAITTVDGSCVGRNCPLQDQPVDCIVCAVEAAILNKVLQNNTKADVDKKLAELCAKLPDQLRVKCNQAVQQKIDPIMDEIAKNPNENPKQVCQAVGRCSASAFEELAEKIVSRPADNPIECLACSIEAALVKKALETNTKAQIDANLTMVCNKLPDQLKQKCLDGITNLINPLIDQLVQNQNETPKQACQAIGKCAQSADEDLEQLVEAITTVDGSCVGRNCPLQDSSVDCIVCAVEAAILNKALQNNTKADVDKKLAELCAKLPDQLRVKCNQAVQQKIDPIMDEIAKNPNENPKQVCQAVGRCPASGFEQLVEKIVSRPTANPIDCIACSVEAALLKNALQTNTKAQIDANMTMLCQRLPEQLRQKCLDGINTQIDPLIDELVKNPNDAPKQACQVVGRCAAHSVDEDLEQLVESATTVVGRCVGRGCPLQDSPVDCIVCAVEAAILNKVLQNNTKADVDKKLAEICARLPDQLRVKCNQAIQQKIDPIMDEIAKNPNENPKQVCQAVGRCPASVLEELVEKVTSPADNQLDCVVCGVEAALVAKALQTQTKAQIDANLTMLCQKLPQQIQQKCLDAITNKIDPIIAELQQNPNETPKQVCVAVNRCTANIDEQLEQLVQSAVSVRDSCHYPDCETSSESLDCIVCAVEAAILNKVLQNNTKADVDKKLAELCAKLPDQLRVRCNQAVTQKIDPIMDEIAKNPNENPKQVCQAVGRCSADNKAEEDFEELAAVVAPTVVDPKPGVDCAMCGLESSILAKKLSQGSTKANIDKKLNKLCDKLPKSLRATCHNDVQTKIDPLMDGLLANQYDPKKACQIVGRCP